MFKKLLKGSCLVKYSCKWIAIRFHVLLSNGVVGFKVVNDGISLTSFTNTAVSQFGDSLRTDTWNISMSNWNEKVVKNELTLKPH